MTNETQLNRQVPLITSARATLLISLTVAMLSGGQVVAQGPNETAEILQIRKQFVEFYIAKSNADASIDDMPVDDESVASYTKTLDADGTWPDINYESKRRAKWDVVDHLRRLQAMAIAHVNPKSRYYGQEELKEKVLGGLDHWLQKDYRNPNWYNAKIRVPKMFTQIFLLLGKDLPEPMLEQALETVLNRTEISMNGQNRVWCSGIVLIRGVLTGDHQSIREASEAIWSEVKVAEKEEMGIQADWTFHQHGPQIQMGAYGLSFAEDMVKWASVLRGTSYAAGSEKLALLQNYILEGMAWFYWKGRMDLSSIGRLVRKGRQKQKGQDLFNVSKAMIDIDPENAKRYDLNAYQLTGFKGYWRSDVAVARRPEWYASIKMASTRTIGAETNNSDNMLGLHQGDGVLLHYQSGLEYEDIQPVWDWRRLPGTTCDQGLTSLKPVTSETRGKSSFVGVLGDGKNGVAALVYHRAKLSAQKAWFVFDDRIVCLGAGIRGESLGSVYTSVEQRWSASRALSSAGVLTKGATSIKANNWVHHQGVGYRMLTDVTVSIQNVKGDWKRVFPTWPWGEAAGDVFSIWIDHGKSPEGVTYAYTLFPKIAEDMIYSTTAETILSNTESVQAVTLNGDLSAVFYAPGKIDLDGTTVRVDRPCLLMQRKGQLYISDPTQKEETITVSQGKKSATVKLPTGQMAGGPAEVH